MTKVRNIGLIILLGVIVWSLYYFFFPPVQQKKEEPFPQGNILTNSSFEKDSNDDGIPDGWGEKPYHSSMQQGGPDGASYVSIRNEASTFSIGSQKVSLDGRQVPLLEVSAYVKADGIEPGGQPWENGKIQVLFFDKNDKQVSGWEEIGGYTGTFDWKKVKKVFQVPRAARSVQINIGLWNCMGSIAFDGLEAKAKQLTTADRNNYVLSGDFEIWRGWVYGGSPDWGIQYPGHHGDGMLFIGNDVPMWSFASQSIRLDAAEAAMVSVSAYVKVQEVTQGANPWEQARINIEFKDLAGNRLGGWPIVYSTTGTHDWKRVENSFPVPEGTAKVELFAGLLNCTGKVWFDDIEMRATDKNGAVLAAHPTVTTDTHNWFVFEPGYIADGGILDQSRYLDKPAGKHGHVVARKGKIFFEDGSRARFFGTNVFGPSLFMDKESARNMADRLARLGINLVRIHHLDAAWSDPNVFDPLRDDTRHLSPESLDKLDFFIAELKKRGIYYYMDLLVHRGFREGDEVEDHARIGNGAKITAFYDERLLELQKEYARQLLTHRNPYTGMRYVDDPALAMVDIINESSLFYIGAQTWLPESSTAKLDRLFNAWLRKKYKTHEELDYSWTSKYGAPLLDPDEDLDKGTVRRGQTLLRKNRSADAVIDRRETDTLAFYYEIEKQYFLFMRDYLRSIGLKAPVAGSNHWENVEYDLKANAEMDFIDRHRYWNHPQFGYGVAVVFDNLSMLRYPERSLPAVLAAQRIKEKPYVVSEWNTCWPGDYYGEGPAIMASYANMQDWDGLVQFSFNHPAYQSVLNDNFDASALPNVISQLIVASEIFHSGVVSPSAKEIYERIDQARLDALIDEDRGVYDQPLLSLVARVGKYFSDKRPAHEKNREPEVKGSGSGNEYTGSNGQLVWSAASGFLRVAASSLCGAVGFTGDRLLDLEAVRVMPVTEFSSIFFVSRDNKPVADSGTLLLVASGRAENSGMIYNSAKTQIVDIGDSPILLEGVTAQVQIPCDEQQDMHVYALDLSGEVRDELPVKKRNGFADFTISPTYKTLYYLIKR